jgi:hypothetical protein
MRNPKAALPLLSHVTVVRAPAYENCTKGEVEDTVATVATTVTT